MQEVASSIHSHAVHARAHAGGHAKPQSGSDFAAMLDEMTARDSGASPDASTPFPDQSPTPDQTPQAVAKAVDTGTQPPIAATPARPAPTLVPAPAADTAGPDQQTKAACLDGKSTLPTDPKLSDKPNLLSSAETKPDQKTDAADANQPVVTDKPVLPTGNSAAAVAPSPTIVPTVPPPPPTPASVALPAVIAAPGVAVSPATVPAQPAAAAPPAPAQSAAAGVPPVQARPPEQQAQPSADPALPPQDVPFTAPVAGPAIRQISVDGKAPKQGQQPRAPAQTDADDQPQGVAATAPEQGAPSLAGAKPAVPAAVTPGADKAAASAHRPSLELAAKSDAPQTFDDLLNAPAAQADAAAANGPAAATANQTASAAPAAASSTPAPQNLLGPVPLSGIPVLIAGKALAGSNHFDIRLDPPELGRIEVRLKVDRDGQVSSHLIADRADTLALLRRDQTGLERALQDAGLKTGGDGLQFSLRDQGGNGQPGGQPPSSLLVQDNPLPDLPTRGYVAYTARAGGIDIHV